ncbi:hypothetical protein DPMN_191224 [Dreissena polymorpha]|uniref:Uncharacterized protein n=1 Tax=Dreissena polymorpha TaxID=45954 RepID=A0A9D3Y0A8_DREPO|nr:hypothetical protein DPMN_191224 [Dreissena polymorpha]
MSCSLLQVPSWSGRPSETVTDCLGLSYRCPDDLGTVQIVWESPGTGFGCRQSVKRPAVVV